jgi:putative endonuclease
MKESFIYILFNRPHGTLYVGVTSNLIHRVTEHKSKVYDGFTKKYSIDKLGYYEMFDDIRFAIEREKQLKAGNRKQKIQLIENMNPGWRDLFFELKI